MASVYWRSSELQGSRVPGGEWAAGSPEIKVCVQGGGGGGPC